MTRIVNLPFEIIVEILNYLTAKEIMILSHVSKFFYVATTSITWNKNCLVSDSCYLPTTVKFKSIYLDYIVDSNNIGKLFSLKSIKTLGFCCMYNNETDYYSKIELIFKLLVIHLTNIGCENIVCGHMDELSKKVFLISPGTNYYITSSMESLFLRILYPKLNIVPYNNQTCKKVFNGEHYTKIKNSYKSRYDEYIYNINVTKFIDETKILLAPFAADIKPSVPKTKLIQKYPRHRNNLKQTYVPKYFYSR